MTYQCKLCEFHADTDIDIEKIIDHIYGHSLLDGFNLTREEALQLKKFIYDQGYVSYEFHFGMIEIIKKLDKYLGD